MPIHEGDPCWPRPKTKSRVCGINRSADFLIDRRTV